MALLGSAVALGSPVTTSVAQNADRGPAPGTTHPMTAPPSAPALAPAAAPAQPRWSYWIPPGGGTAIPYDAQTGKLDPAWIAASKLPFAPNSGATLMDYRDWAGLVPAAEAGP